MFLLSKVFKLNKLNLILLKSSDIKPHCPPIATSVKLPSVPAFDLSIYLQP